MSVSVYDDIAAELRGLARTEVQEASPPIERWRIVKADPLTIEQVGGDLLLEDGDADFEVERSVRRALEDPDDPTGEGDVLYVHHDGDTWAATGVAEGDD